MGARKEKEEERMTGTGGGMKVDRRDGEMKQEGRKPDSQEGKKEGKKEGRGVTRKKAVRLIF